MTARQPDGNYMKGIDRNDIAAEYNKNLRYANIKDVIAESKATRERVDMIIKKIAWWSS